MSLKRFFDDIIDNVSLDFTSPELQDIISAVNELVGRYASQFQVQDFPFRISRVQQCGSMHEKTGVWKTKLTRWIDKGPFAIDEPIPFIEFDFLAVLDTPSDFKPVDSCPGCIWLKGEFGIDTYNKLMSCGQLDSTVYDERFRNEISRNTPDVFQKLFAECLNKSLVSSCNCFRIEINKHKLFRYRDIPVVVSECKENCPKQCVHCTVYRQTGYLRLGTGDLPKHGLTNTGSFTLVWTSETKSLLAPSFSLLVKNKQMNTISIHVDFLPAFEQLKDGKEHNCFIVAKRCSLEKSRNRNWRVSFCMLESDVISSQHSKCHIVIKYLFERLNSSFELSPNLNGYHGKTAVLNHSRKCTNHRGDYVGCIVAIIRDLRDAYSKASMKTYVNKRGDLLRTYTTNEEKAIVMDCLLQIFEKIERKLKLRWRLNPWKQKLYSPWLCVRIIERLSNRRRS